MLTAKNKQKNALKECRINKAVASGLKIYSSIKGEVSLLILFFCFFFDTLFLELNKVKLL